MEGNTQKIIQNIQLAKDYGVDIVSFPELSITGYPPEDLLLKPKFVEDNLKYLKEIAQSAAEDIISIVGFVDRNKDNIYNAAAVIQNGSISAVYHKMLLPNYGVFDEKRYFSSGDKPLVLRIGKCLVGVSICEDIWNEGGPVKKMALSGAKLIVNINASPYHMGKVKEREAVIIKQAKENKVFIAYTNLIGGQDELVFDGQSMVVNNKGKIIRRAAAFREELLLADLEIPIDEKNSKRRIIQFELVFSKEEKPALPKKDNQVLNPVEEVYKALCLGLKDYIQKNGFKKVVVGLSGGVDSALVATLAVDALGRDNVAGIFMPSRYSSLESEVDAQLLAKNLEINFKSISIEHIYKLYLLFFESHFIGLPRDITEENIQARIRGNMLMAFSNKFNWLVLTTGNKSEMSTGYATLYGDMAGGFALIKDVPKTLVYKLCEYRNSLKEIIPERILTKAPTAELRANQKDTDSLPEYEVLDSILKAYVEEDKSQEDIIKAGFDPETVKKVITLVDKSEYKRRQAPPGIKITPKAFGRDRRMPITNKYRG
ncbi:MAG: NAD+ synthase [Candidatus Omnitrophota bacterium]